jgi:catechol 2,3-dioxygenase-like lactoylglutathione lyase family enzyme
VRLSLSDSIRVKRIDHVTIVVKDLNRSRDFYVGLLGMDDVARPAFSFFGAWFQAGATLLHLIEEHDKSGVAGVAEDRGHNSRCHHFAFEVEDTYAAAQILKDRGQTIIHDAKLRPDGAVQVFVADPDGHVIELCTSVA